MRCCSRSADPRAAARERTGRGGRVDILDEELNFELPKFLGAIMAAAPRAGDVLLAVGAPPQVQIEGTLVPLRMTGLERLSPFQTETVMLHLLAGAPAAVARVRANGAAHFSYSLSAITRFRVAVFSQRGTFAISLRTIPYHIPALAELNLPEVMREACGGPGRAEGAGSLEPEDR